MRRRSASLHGQVHDVLLNRLERYVMNNPLRVFVQRRVEGPRMVRLGGALPGGDALEVGCGSGAGVQLIHELFGADRVDAFDLDAKMIGQARARLARRGIPARLWVGDATAIAAADRAYDAVFDFGVLHHVPDWRRALSEVARVLRPGGRFYAEEVLRPFLTSLPVRALFDHPRDDRFDSVQFVGGVRDAGLIPIASEQLAGAFGWFFAVKAVANV